MLDLALFSDIVNLESVTLSVRDIYMQSIRRRHGVLKTTRKIVVQVLESRCRVTTVDLFERYGKRVSADLYYEKHLAAHLQQSKGLLTLDVTGVCSINAPPALHGLFADERPMLHGPSRI